MDLRKYKKYWKAPAMMMSLVLLFFVGARAKNLSSSYVICKNEKEVRTLRTEKNDDSGKCQIFYNKSGIDQMVGEAQNPQSCLDILKRVQDKLEAVSWKCRKASGSTVSDLGEQVQ